MNNNNVVQSAQSLANNFKNNLGVIASQNKQNQNNNDDGIKNINVKFFNEFFKKLFANYPAYKASFNTLDEINYYKREMVKALQENNINTQELLERGLSACRRDESNFLPSAGKFVSYCLVDEMIMRYEALLLGKPLIDPNDFVEIRTNSECSYDVKRVLSRKDGIKLYSDTYNKNKILMKTGQLKPVKPAPKIEEKFIHYKPKTDTGLAIMNRLTKKFK